MHTESPSPLKVLQPKGAKVLGLIRVALGSRGWDVQPLLSCAPILNGCFIIRHPYNCAALLVLAYTEREALGRHLYEEVPEQIVKNIQDCLHEEGAHLRIEQGVLSVAAYGD